MSATDPPSDPTRDRRDRRRFHLALGLFFVWVAMLGTLAVLTGRGPAENRGAIERR
jgi:hypothetical protein